MNPDKYKVQLLAKEQELSARVDRAMATVREPGDGAARDISDDSVNDEGRDEQFTEAEADRAVLGQVRDALKRIDDGTFGTCVRCGRPIAPERLEALPWAAHCIDCQRIVGRGG